MTTSRFFCLPWKVRLALSAIVFLCAFMLPSSSDAQTWAPVQTLSAGSEPISSLTTADLLGNGTSEVLGVSASGKLLQFDNPGSLTAGHTVDAGGDVLSAAAGAFDVTALDDVIVLERVSTGLKLLDLPNAGATALGAPVAIPFHGPLSEDCRLYAGDVNGDGIPDLIIGCPSSGVVWAGLNQGSGAFSFQAFRAVDPSRHVVQFGVGDLDGDGRADILVENVGSDGNPRTDVLRSKATGGFAVQQWVVDLSSGPVAVAPLAGHLRSDVLQAAAGETLTVYSNRGDGSFKPASVQNEQICEIHAVTSGHLVPLTGAQGLDIVVSANCGGSESLIVFANTAQSVLDIAASAPTADASGNITLSVDVTSAASPATSGTLTLDAGQKASVPVVNGAASFPISLLTGNNAVTLTYAGDEQHSGAKWQGLIVWGGAGSTRSAATRPIKARSARAYASSRSLTASPQLQSASVSGSASAASDATAAISGLTLLSGSSDTLPLAATSRQPLLKTAGGGSFSASPALTISRVQSSNLTYRTVQANVSQQDPESQITYPATGNMDFAEDGSVVAPAASGTSTYGVSDWTKGQCSLTPAGWAGSQCAPDRSGPLNVAYESGMTTYSASIPVASTAKEIEANYSYTSPTGLPEATTEVLKLQPLCTGGKSGCTGTGSTGTAVINSGPTGTVTDGSTVTFSVGTSGATCVETQPGYSFTISDGTDSCSINNVGLSGGSCSFVVTVPGGTHNVIASIGNAYCGTGTPSAPYSMSVALSSPSITVSCSPNPLNFGANTTCSSNVSGGYSPTGSEAWTINGGAWTTTGLNGSAVGFNLTNPGSFTVGVRYSGDTSNNPASASTTLTIVKDSPSVSLSATHTSVVYGQLTAFTATVVGGHNATGSVNFDIGSTAGVFGTVPLSGNSATYNSNNETWAPGTYPIYAVYSGDAGNNGATGSIGGFTVVKQTPAATITSSGVTVPSGSSVTLTAQVVDTQPAGFQPSGTVTFLDGSTSIGTATLSNGVASFTSASLSGSHSFSFSYAGDGNYNPTSSASTNVQAGASAILMDVFASPTGVMAGAPVALQGIIDTGGGRSATGSIDFASNGTSIGSVAVSTVTTTNLLSTNVLGSETYQATVTDNSQTAPDGSVTAETVSIPAFSTPEAYVGLNSNVTPAAGTVYTYSIWLKAPTPTQVVLRMTQTCGYNNAVATVTAGTSWQRFALTETTGTPCSGGLLVRLNEYGPSSTTATLYAWGAQLEQAAQPGPFVPTNGAAATGTGAVATLTTSTLPVGTDSITVSYPGDPSNQPGTGGPAIVQVAMASPALAITSSVNPSVSGTLVTFTATLSSGDSPSGTVKFLDGATTLGIGTVSGGVATYATNSLSVGTHSITASYGGDANNNTVTSSALSQVVNKGAPTLSVSSSENPSLYGDSVTFTASLPANATGTIIFKDGAATIGSGNLSGGSATFTTSGLSVGTHSIAASYTGDSNYSAAISSVLSQVVNKAPITLSVISSLNPSHYNQSVILTVTGSSSGAVPTGSVTITEGGNSLGTLTLTPTGEAAITTNTLAAGIHHFTFTYNGDGNYY